MFKVSVVLSFLLQWPTVCIMSNEQKFCRRQIIGNPSLVKSMLRSRHWNESGGRASQSGTVL